LEVNTVPEIMRCNLSGVVLNLKAMGIKDVRSIDFIDKPDTNSILKAFEILIKLEALDPLTADLTKSGLEMSVFPTEPILSKLLLTALKPKYLEIRKEIAGVVAMLSIENVFFNPSHSKTEKELADLAKKRLRLLDSRSDHLGLLKLLQTY
jgi:HrpA-like RNA helicase